MGWLGSAWGRFLGNEKGALGSSPERPRRTTVARWISHVVIGFVAEEIGGKQHHRLLAGVLPPMRGSVQLRRHVAGLVDQWHRAVARIFGDLALDDVDDGR